MTKWYMWCMIMGLEGYASERNSYKGSSIRLWSVKYDQGKLEITNKLFYIKFNFYPHFTFSISSISSQNVSHRHNLQFYTKTKSNNFMKFMNQCGSR